jgi:uracil phosphoribosyltransferase
LEPIMSKQITLVTILSAALLMAAGAAQAAPSKEGVVTLPRVVVTGKAVKQLPTVVVTGYSAEGQLRRQVLAQAKTEAKPVRRI